MSENRNTFAPRARLTERERARVIRQMSRSGLSFSDWLMAVVGRLEFEDEGLIWDGDEYRTVPEMTEIG